jgi:hypothetical protein
MSSNKPTSLSVTAPSADGPNLTSILKHIAALGSDRHFFGSVTVRFQGPLGPVYVTTERGQRPQELAQEVANVRS